MSLTFRRIESQNDFEVSSGGFIVGTIYEESAASERIRWYWTINGVRAGRSIMRTDGRVATLDGAKEQLTENLRKWLAWAKLEEIE
jgi:hypothetical protein